jgi:two-component system, chemotaxis family, CheB/CheR fusion protein
MSEAQPIQGPHDLVVVGSSAGGVEALSILVGTLPEDFPAPLVLAQHVDPNRPSQLPGILQRATKLRVVVVTEPTTMENGHIYLVPSNLHVTINDSTVGIETDLKGRPRPSIDLLLSTAARSYGERLYAVILTGSGSDGAVGAVEVKNADGTVIIQNPATARYPSMPLALPPTAIDHVCELETIGPTLYNLITKGSLPAQTDGSDATLQNILELVSSQTNIDFRNYKPSTIVRRIGRRMAATQTQSMRQYVQYLQRHPEEVGELVGSFLINVTQFFRDREPFAVLRRDVLGPMIKQRRDGDRELRFWSAGCATGEEAYSLAMLIADLLGAELPEWSVKIFATDLDGPAITYARTGVYPENAIRNLQDGFGERYFERLDNNQGYRITKELRQMIIFGQQDLSRSAPFPRIDLVMCRNVLIYFSPDLQEHVLHNFAFSLRPQHGYLFLGKAETIRPSIPFYELIDKQWKLYRCTGSMGPGRTLGHVPVYQPPVIESPKRVTRSVEKAAEHEPPNPSAELSQIRRLNEALLRFLPIGVVVIDRTYRMVSINAAARRLLSVRDAVTDHDFLHAARALPYANVRNAIDGVFRERNPALLAEVQIDTAHGEAERFLSMSIVLLQTDHAAPDLLAITISDVTEQVQNRRQLEAAQTEQTRLLNELETANKQLSQYNKELVDANEELQIANEELVLTQEELQATVEEFETTNEELQATNEELETNNEELQATNEELETTNEELRATANELEIMTRVLETERARLISMVELAPFYTIVCRGPNLIVETVDSRYLRNVMAEQIEGHPLREVASFLWDISAQIVDLAQRAFASSTVQLSPRLSVTGVNEHGQHLQEFYVFTMVPSLDDERRTDGLVIYAANETLRQERERDEERERLRLIFERTEQVALVLYDAQTTELLTASPRYLEIAAAAHGVEPQSLIGRKVTEVAINNDPDPLVMWQQVIDSRQPLRRPEVRIDTPDGETIWDWTLTPIVEPQQPDVVRYMLVSAVEVTQQVQARQELERLDLLKDEFLSSASHELRTPLTTLIGYGHIMRQLVVSLATADATTAGRLSQYVDIFNTQLARLNRLVGDLVDVSRLQSGKLSVDRERVALQPLIRRVAKDVEVMGIEQPLRIDMPPGNRPLVVLGDADRLQQVISNLLQNATTYAPQSPHFDLRLKRITDDNGVAWAQIEVQDYGPGIPPQDHDAIFGRLYQVSLGDRRARKGLGLGLYIARQIVEQHGGTLTVESTVGQGSTFVICLPLAV